MSKKKIFLRILMVIGGIIVIVIVYHLISFIGATNRMNILGANLEEEIAVWEKKEYHRPPLKAPAIPGNAALFYQQAEAFVQPTRDKGISDYFIDLGDAIRAPDKPLTAKARECIEKYKGVIDIIKKGANAEFYKSRFNIRDGFTAKFPSLLTPRNIVNLMILNGRELEKEGKFTEAIEQYCALIRYGNDLFRDGSLIASMIGIAISAIPCEDQLQPQLQRNNIPPQYLKELINYLQILNDSEPKVSDTFLTERLNEGIGLCKAAQTKSFFPWIDKYVRTHESPLRISNRTTYIDAAEDVMNFNAEMANKLALPYGEYAAWANQFDYEHYGRNWISRVIIPNVMYGNIAVTQTRALHRGLYILAGLRLYQAKYQKYPDNLNDLVPECLAKMPMDPFTDKPFIYRVKPGNKLMLYSVGSNLKDDNCQVKRPEEFVIINENEGK